MNGVKSNSRQITCGVPQGSILGPLLFLIYINDLGTISSHFSMILFADDSNLFIKGKDLDSITSALNDKIAVLVDWLRANRLSLNIDKTHYMLFTPKKREIPPDINILINGTRLTRVTECKFLGVMIDEKITWKAHINYISRKAAKTLGILNKARRYFQQPTLITLYYAFLYPLLLYCAITWGNAPASTLWPLFRIQKRAIRLIRNIRKRDSTSKHFKDLNILKVPDIYQLQAATFMYNYAYGKLPSAFATFFNPIGGVHGHNTRGDHLYRPPLYKTSLGNSFIKKTGIPIWTKIRQQIKKDYFSINMVKKIVIKELTSTY